MSEDDAPVSGGDEDAAVTEPENAARSYDEPAEGAASGVEDSPAADEPGTQAAETAEPLTLPDERHSRTTELAARLRQSALAQVEAARAAQAEPVAASPTEAAPVEQPAAPVEEPQPVAPAEPAAEVTEPPAPSAEPVEATDGGADAEADAEPEVADEVTAPVAERPRDRLRMVTAAAALLAVAAAVVLVIFIVKDSNDTTVAKARLAALKAAETETAAALTYNYQTLDADFARAEAGMSTSMRANYAQTATTQVAPLARNTHAVTTATIAAAGVVSATGSSAQVLVFADQTVQNKLLHATSRLDRSVIQVSMVKQNGRWVIDHLQPF